MSSDSKTDAGADAGVDDDWHLRRRMRDYETTRNEAQRGLPILVRGRILRRRERDGAGVAGGAGDAGGAGGAGIDTFVVWGVAALLAVGCIIMAVAIASSPPRFSGDASRQSAHT